MGVDLARYVVKAVVVEGRGVREVARSVGRSPAWVSGRVSAWRLGGDAALFPRSRAPRRQANKMSPETEDEIVLLRKELSDLGLDAGAETIRYHLGARLDVVPSRSSIWRALKRRGFVQAQPQKKPRAAWIRFESELPNETWQTDITHWKLAHGIEVEILDFIDDHSRVVVGAHVRLVTKAQDVVDSFEQIGAKWGFPASVLSDNGMVFTGRARKTRVAFETYLAKLGIETKHSRPNHPTTCGKIERFHQTLKKHLRSQPRAENIAELQQQVDWFVNYYNTVRPHRAKGRKPPMVAFDAKPKAEP
jgi:transposase InsO family protein